MKTILKLFTLCALLLHVLINPSSMAQAGPEPTSSLHGWPTKPAVTTLATKDTLLSAHSPPGRIMPQDELAHDTQTYEVLPFQSRMKLADLSIQPPYDETLSTSHITLPTASYSMAYLNTLGYDALVQLLVTIQWYDIPDLFEFNSDSFKFYEDESRVQFIIDALESRGHTYTTADSQGIDTLVEVLRSGFYLGFYYSDLAYLNEQDFHNKCLPALKAIATNPAFSLGTAEQDKVVDAYGKLIGNASSNDEIVTLTTPILQQFNANFVPYAKSYSKGNALYSLLSGIDYDITSYLRSHNLPPAQSPWFQQIDSFLNELRTIALYGEVTNDTDWIINNGIYYISRLGELHTTSSIGLQTITESLDIYPYLSETYYTAAQQISTVYDGIDYNGNTIDYAQLIEDGKDYYLPKTTVFDDESIVMKTGEDVTDEKILRLYWASKEVKAQFHRVVGSDTPVHDSDHDDTLTIVIYNSPQEYRMNRLLYGYDTNNGGIYIERDGTFFTYERTPEQSIYSLEDLFRHEMTHYLQGRYLIPELFGQGPIYANERLTWFSEGGAEFFAGSTRTDRVVPRKTIINNFATHPRDRYTLEQTLYATYGTWDFYNYAFALQSYMYTHRFDLLDELHQTILANNAPAYDHYRETLSLNSAVKYAYQQYMQHLIDRNNNHIDPAVSDDYLQPPTPKSLVSVQNEVTEILPLTNVALTEQTSNSFQTFLLKGTYIGEETAGAEHDWQQLNTVLDHALEELAKKPWNGYKTVTAYFTDYTVNEHNQVACEVVLHGVASNIVSSIEPNESIDTATPLPLNTGFVGGFDENNELDIFAIDVDSSPYVSIDVENTQNIGMNWVVYSETDLTNPVAYATTSGLDLSGAFQANPGTYYLYVYSYDSRPGEYSGITLTE
ncbi:collagenase [Shouchella lonarensis]|uniref:microbial collagenase n=1 Tax=Shouchella lonarensis TaxID=1464122 RepID=A0A1G6HLB3_9BACI|nr:collagenase [Shouchella lonarensis]SDB94908.1 microbial collagenase [Shouchella lonarensis]